MTSTLLAANIHLGLELFGAIIIFITAWLFAEAYFIKKDLFSLGRTLGFSFLIVWQIMHALGGESSLYFISSFAVYVIGLSLIFLSYWLEKLPPKPEGLPAFIVLPLTTLLAYFHIIPTVLLAGTAYFLARRYSKDIDRQLKWLAVAFSLLFAASVFSNFSTAFSLSPAWITEHALHFLGFVAMGMWILRYLSLRAREETLIIFVSTSLFIALLVTTIFSVFLLQRIQQEAETNLAANGKILNFYIDSLKNKSLAGSQIIAGNDDFVSALKSNDITDLKKVAAKLLKSTGEQFLTVASTNGDVLFKIGFPALKDENVLSERIGAEAAEGRLAAGIDNSPAEGISIRAAAPVFSNRKIIGTIITGFVLDKSFDENFRKISGLETTVFSKNRVVSSSVLPAGEVFPVPTGEFLGSTKFLDQEVIGYFEPIVNFENKPIGSLALTTTPGELLINAQATNRLTVLIIFLIIGGCIIPLYRFSSFLTERF